MLKRILACLLASSMLFAFVSCGGTAEDTTTVSTTTAQTTEATTAQTTTEVTEATTAQTTTTETTTEETTTAETTTEETTTAIDPELEVKKSFDEENIVLSFAALSDIHIGNFNANDESNFKKALKQISAYAAINDKDGIDAIIGVGDLTDKYTNNQSEKSAEIAALKAVYESSLDPNKVPFIYTLGNHDHDFESTGNAGIDLAGFLYLMGNEKGHKQYDVECPDAAHGSRHAVIENYHFLFVEPITYISKSGDSTGVKYYPETLAWLDAELTKITAENPDHYVFVMTHPMIYDTVYGSDLVYGTTHWYTKEIITVLEKYPQIVTFGGHLHFPLNDPRSIMQTAFTSLGCASVNYMALEAGSYHELNGTAQSGTQMTDRAEFSQGLLCQLDANGNLRITRMDFYHDTTIGEDWTISFPTADGAHLNTYGKDRGSDEKNAAPVFTTLKVVAEGEKGNKTTLEFFAEDDEFTHHYEISLTNKKTGKLLKTWKPLADFYRHGDPANMTQPVSFYIGTLSQGTYEISITACDSWVASTTIVFEYTPTGTPHTVEIPLS